MTDITYKRFVKRWEEVMELPPTNLGPLTPYYKSVAKRLKVMPWSAFVVLAGLAVVALYLLIGSAITFLVTILQRGF